jgi:radical SAM superfamily enzyme YgiQ (UPF0313 family)
MVKTRENGWNKYALWKPLGLMVLAGLTPRTWDIRIIDENLAVPDYRSLPRPDLVGITAFTSQASRAYEIAGHFRALNVAVVMGGIHATMCCDEALQQVTTVVTGEAESVWAGLLDDWVRGTMRQRYDGNRLDLAMVPAARHDLLTDGYFFGSIQTSRGCPLACSFCSVTAFNGGKFRRRPIDQVIAEFRTVKEKHVLVVDDNFIGTRAEHIDYTKALLRAMIDARLNKRWIAQVTINIADDEELLALARVAGCMGVFIGFESTSAQGLVEVSKKFSIREPSSIQQSIQRIHNHRISVLGSFIVGLDSDGAGSGANIAQVALGYGLDILNVMVLTPLPGTRLWKTMVDEGRVLKNNFPHDWKYFTLTFPVAQYTNLSWAAIVAEREGCYRNFYSYRNIIVRLVRALLQKRNAAFVLICNLVFRMNTLFLDRSAYTEFDIEGDRGQNYLNICQESDGAVLLKHSIDPAETE